jgi:Tol biopolymer transport system component
VHALTHLEGPEYVSWSPDGSRLGVVSATKDAARIEIVRLQDDSERVVSRRPAGSLSSLAWSPNGRRFAFTTLQEARDVTGTFETISVDGTERKVVARFPIVRLLPSGPAWSRDGRQVAFFRPVPSGRSDQPRIVLADRPERPLTHAAPATEWGPRWSPDGGGLLFVREQRDDGPVELATVAATGGVPHVLLADLADVDADWSPDGRRIAYLTVGSDRRYHLYVLDLGGKASRKLTGEVETCSPRWSPDGNRIAFATYDGSVRTIRPDGSDEIRVAKVSGAEIEELAWSPAGDKIAFVASNPPPD